MSSVAIVASHELEPTPEIVAQIAAALAVLEPPSDPIHAGLKVRANNLGITSLVEDLAVQIATTMHVHVSRFYSTGPKRNEVFNRDYMLVGGADRVIAFFSGGREMEGGTGHVVHAALQKGVPVEAWSLDDDGTLINIGSDDGLDIDEGRVSSFQHKWKTYDWATALGYTPTITPVGTLPMSAVKLSSTLPLPKSLSNTDSITTRWSYKET